MKTQHSFVAATLFLVVQGVAHAAQTTFMCPQSIPEASVHLVAPDREWKTYVSSPLYLSGAAPADGPPEQLGVLRESHSITTKNGWTYKYLMSGPYPDGKWLRCDYGTYGEVSLAKRLPDDIQECTVTGKKGPHAGESQLEIRCL